MQKMKKTIEGSSTNLFICFTSRTSAAAGASASSSMRVPSSKFLMSPNRSSSNMVIDKGGCSSESLTNVAEVPRRTTRSHGLAESVLWSPVIEKKRGTKNVRQNAEPKLGSEEDGGFAEAPPFRSLRNRVVVVVGGADELVADQSAKSPTPVTEKKRGTKGVRQNAEPNLGKEEEGVSDVAPPTGSLRNRVVVVGGADELAVDQNAGGMHQGQG